MIYATSEKKLPTQKSWLIRLFDGCFFFSGNVHKVWQSAIDISDAGSIK